MHSRLERNQSHSEEETVSVTSGLEELLDELDVSVLAANEILGFDLFPGLRELPGDVLVINGKVSNARESGCSFLVSLEERAGQNPLRRRVW